LRKHLVRNKNIEKFLYRIYRESFNEGIRPISRLEGSILMTLTTLICLKGTATLLDAGAGLGFSTAWLILGSALLPNINVTIDVVEYNKNRFEKLVSNIRELLNTTQLKRVRINYIFEDVIEYLKKINYQYDLAFIDIEKHQYLDILNILIDKMRIGGFVVFHNVIEPPPPQVFIEKLHSEPWRTIIIPTRRGLSVSIKLV